MRDFHMADDLLTLKCKSNGADGTYSGLVHRGLAHAYGVLTLADGGTYCGEFNRGEQDGLGCWQYADSNIIEWTENEFCVQFKSLGNPWPEQVAGSLA